MMRRFAIGLLAVAAVLLSASAASAQSSSYGAPTPSSDNQTVSQGSNITINFQNMPPSTDFSAVVQSITMTLPTQHSDANGNVSVTFNTAGLAVGEHTLTLTGGGTTAVAHFTVVAGSALPRTGSSSALPLTSIALALLAAGGLLVLVARRRRISTAD